MSDEPELVLESVATVSSEVGSRSLGLLEDSMAVFQGQKLVAVQTFLDLLTKNLSFHEFSREVLLAVMNAVHCEAGSILEMHPTEPKLFFRASAGRSSDSVNHFMVPVGQGIAGHAAESKTLVVVDDANNDEKHLKSMARAVGFEVRNLIAIPVLIRGNVFGVIEVINRVGNEKFSAGDIEVVQYIADMASKCIEIRLMLGYRASEEKSAA